MAEQLELSDYLNTHELRGMMATSTSAPSAPVDDAEKSERRLFRLGVLTLALLCIIQATLNLSLRLAFSVHSKADVDPFAFNGSVVGFCQKEQLQQNSSQLSLCCNNLLGVQRENQKLKRERNRLLEQIKQIEEYVTIDEDYSGSGFM